MASPGRRVDRRCHLLVGLAGGSPHRGHPELIEGRGEPTRHTSVRSRTGDDHTRLVGTPTGADAFESLPQVDVLGSLPTTETSGSQQGVESDRQVRGVDVRVAPVASEPGRVLGPPRVVAEASARRRVDVDDARHGVPPGLEQRDVMRHPIDRYLTVGIGRQDRHRCRCTVGSCCDDEIESEVTTRRGTAGRRRCAPPLHRPVAPDTAAHDRFGSVRCMRRERPPRRRRRRSRSPPTSRRRSPHRYVPLRRARGSRPTPLGSQDGRSWRRSPVQVPAARRRHSRCPIYAADVEDGTPRNDRARRGYCRGLRREHQRSPDRRSITWVKSGTSTRTRPT